MANITIDLNNITPDYNTEITKLLEEAKLPTCLGNMAPILLRNSLTIPEEDVCAIKDSLPPEHITGLPLQDFLIEKNIIHEDKFLKKEGLQLLQEYKKRIAVQHVSKLVLCSQCNLTEICYKLTNLYIESIKILENS